MSLIVLHHALKWLFGEGVDGHRHLLARFDEAKLRLRDVDADIELAVLQEHGGRRVRREDVARAQVRAPRCALRPAAAHGELVHHRVESDPPSPVPPRGWASAAVTSSILGRRPVTRRSDADCLAVSRRVPGQASSRRAPFLQLVQLLLQRVALGLSAPLHGQRRVVENPRGAVAPCSSNRLARCSSMRVFSTMASSPRALASAAAICSGLGTGERSGSARPSWSWLARRAPAGSPRGAPPFLQPCPDSPRASAVPPPAPARSCASPVAPARGSR